MSSNPILHAIAIILLILSCLAGGMLLILATFNGEKLSKGATKETLWGLFITGLVAGVIMIAIWK